ncbi:MAG TPA: class I SAM-dependent methyltransferase [Acidimicrobiales bacterium]|nr:class I SAM-dependent methyltransferase [Acidimicrobiales bacterium]
MFAATLPPAHDPVPGLVVQLRGPRVRTSVNPRAFEISHWVAYDPAVDAGGGNPGRFSGFADIYDANRPSPPPELGPLLCSYANVVAPVVVDLGSGTGLSSRWAATWAASVVGVEPSDDMRTVAESRPAAGVTYRKAWSHSTGLAERSADVVLAVQAMHWMEPGSTLAEVARVLRPGGVFAVVDADWPPVSGVARAEAAWAALHRRIRVLEARAAAGEQGQELRRPIADDDPALVDEDLADPHRNRAMPGGAQSWSKAGHLERISTSGYFGFTREVMFNQAVPGGVERFVALMASQGSYQALRRLALSDEDIGETQFRHDVEVAFGESASSPGLSFSWRARIGVRA